MNALDTLLELGQDNSYSQKTVQLVKDAAAELATLRAALAASQAREAGLLAIIASLVPVMSCDYEEDDTCVFCGNHISKDHAPDCEYKLAEDTAIGALNSKIIREKYCFKHTPYITLVTNDVCPACEKEKHNAQPA